MIEFFHSHTPLFAHDDTSSIKIAGGSIQRAIHKREDQGDIDVFFDQTQSGANRINHKVQTFKIQKIGKVQIIHGVNFEPTKFDFSCCQCFIDNYGDLWSIGDSLDHIKNKYSTINWDYATEKSKRRYLKYKFQGYSFKRSDERRMLEAIKDNIPLNGFNSIDFYQ